MEKNNREPNWIYYNQNINMENIGIKISKPLLAILFPVHTATEAIKKAPLIKKMFDEAELKGKKEGYVKASQEYENKFFKQAEEFAEQMQSALDNKIKSQELFQEYEEFILGQKSIILTLSQERIDLLNKLNEHISHLEELSNNI